VQLKGAAVVIKTLDDLAEVTQVYSPNKKWYRRMVKRSAVAIIMRQTGDGDLAQKVQ
jgi:adenosine/AMP kinase